jgi:hypothetical protein
MGEGGGVFVGGDVGGGGRCAVPGHSSERTAGASGVELLPPAHVVGRGDLELVPAHFPALPLASAVVCGELVLAHVPALPCRGELELLPAHVLPDSSVGDGLGSVPCSRPLTEAEAHVSEKSRCEVHVARLLVD